MHSSLFSILFIIAVGVPLCQGGTDEIADGVRCYLKVPGSEGDECLVGRYRGAVASYLQVSNTNKISLKVTKNDFLILPFWKYSVRISLHFVFK